MAHGLGRLVAHDPRDGKYTMSLALPSKKFFNLPRFWRYWKSGTILDQGETPQCVGYSWRQWLSSAPIMTKSGPSALSIYSEAQRLDEWPGEDYDGTSVRGGAKALDTRGHIKTYLWASTPDELESWVLNNGPVIVGTNWYNDMFYPNEKTGMVNPTGFLAGGHAYVIIGYNKLLKRYRCVNSWGQNWGQNGRFSISKAHMELLIFGEEGEACAAVEQLISP